MITLEVGGDQYTLFESATVEKRLDAICSAFNFAVGNTSSDNQENPLPFKGGEQCKIYVDGDKVLTGVIEVVNGSYSRNRSHTVQISGRSLASALLDSSLDSFSDLNAPITLKAIIEKVISELKLTLKVIDNVNPAPFNKAEDIASPEPSENAYSFIEKFARKRQVLLTTDADGNVVISDGQGLSINSTLRHLVDSNANNILDATVSYDLTGRFNRYVFASNLTPEAINNAGDIPVTEIVDQNGAAIDPQVLVGRQLVMISEVSMSSEQCAPRAQWEANIRKTRSRVYSVTLNGHRNDEGNLWDVQQLPTVIDAFWDINSRLLVNTVSYNQDSSNGNEVTLGFVDQNAYTLSLSDPSGESFGNEYLA